MKRDKNQAAVELGKLGGKARAEKLSPADRLRISQDGAKARWEGKTLSQTPAAVYQRAYRAMKKEKARA